jgi:superfamily II DNA or RNA helicase
MEIDIHVENIMSRIVGMLPPEVHLTLREDLSYVVSGSIFSEYSKQGMWDGTKNLFNSKTQQFPTGLLRRAVVSLSKCGYSVNVIDKRKKPVGFPLVLKNVTLRDYQIECVQELVSKTRGLLMAGTGSGKTICLAAVIAQLGVNTLVIVPTSGLLHQTAERLSNMLGIEVGMIGDSNKNIGKVTVATFQSLTTSDDCKKRKFDSTSGKWKTVKDKKIVIREDLKEYFQSVECIITDEAHHLVSSSIQRVYDACPNAYYRYGCSATPFSDRDEDVLTEAATGRVLKEYTASFLIREGWLSTPTIHLVPFKQERGGSSTKYADLYNEKIINNTRRNKLLYDIISYRADLGDSVLVSVRYLEHGRILYDMLHEKYGDDVVFVNSKMTTKKLNDTLQKLSNKELKICIGTSLVNEGVNLPSLNTLVLAGTPKSKIATMQLVGRVLRKTDTKSTVDVYDIQDYNAKYFTSASKERFDIYSSESEFVLKEDNMFE